MENKTVSFETNEFKKHSDFIELANNLTNEEKCLLITTLASSMKNAVDVLLVDKDEKVKASFSCNLTWLTASLNRLNPVFAFELDYIEWMSTKGKGNFAKDVQTFVNDVTTNKKEG